LFARSRERAGIVPSISKRGSLISTGNFPREMQEYAMKYFTAAILVLIVSCAAWAAPKSDRKDLPPFAQGSDQPIDITSNKFQARTITGGKEGIFSGNVQVTQADLTLFTDKLIIVYDDLKGNPGSEAPTKRLPRNLQSASGIRSITAVGNVKITQNDRRALAGRAEYDNAKRTITLTGGPPQVWQGPDHVSAHTIVIYLDEERIEMRDGDNSRIKFRINPGKMPQRDKQ